MTRVEGRGPVPRREGADLAAGRRELRRAMKQPPKAGGRPGRAPAAWESGRSKGRTTPGRAPGSVRANDRRSALGRRWPPVLAVALVVLAMSALVGLIAAVAVLSREPFAASLFFAFFVVTLASAFWLARGQRRGYWSAVVLLFLVGGVPSVGAATAGDAVTAVVLLPPVVLAAVMLRRSVRAQLIQPTGSKPDRLPGPPTAVG
jgi:hypothetical protein